MCERLVQEYKTWLGELLEVLRSVCENVVPAGRVDENIYWSTKALCEEIKCGKQKEIDSQLLRYAAEGRQLLAPVKAALTFEREDRTEETTICLRRANANAILNSLQMFANYAYLAGKYVDIYGEFRKYFEVDTGEEVKRIRSGVVVGAALQNSKEVNKIRTYDFREQKVKVWKGNVAG